MQEELIRGRIVVGMNNLKVCEQLHMRSDLTLNMLVDFARQAEIQAKQTRVIQNGKVINMVSDRRNKNIQC